MKPLPVAISALIDNKKLLLIKRKKEPYKGYWSLPGGKIEFSEHISIAAKREIKEETGITSDFVKLAGFFSENLYEKGKVTAQFLLYVCILKPHHNKHKESEEGSLHWFDLYNIKQHKDNIIPSDFLIINHLLIEKEGTYFECDMEKKENDYIIKRFEKIN